jgi:hypothetical protein
MHQYQASLQVQRYTSDKHKLSFPYEVLAQLNSNEKQPYIQQYNKDLKQLTTRLCHKWD